MKHLLMVLSLFLGAVVAAGAETVTPSDWAKKIDIYFPGCPASAEAPIENFPALIRLSSDIAGFSYSDFLSKADGRPCDLRFADAETHQSLDYEIDTWDEEGTSLVWVKIPAFSVNTHIVAYFGKADCAPLAGSDVWGGYAGVWHMNIGGSDPENPIVDSTGHGLNGKSWNAGVVQADGILGKAFYNPYQGSKDGRQNDSRVTLANYNLYLSDHSSFTVSGWFRHGKADYSNGRRLFCHKTINTEKSGWEVYMNSSGSDKLHLRGANTDEHCEIQGVPFKVDGELEWFHVLIVYRGQYVDVYANGQRLSAEGGAKLGSAATENDCVLGLLNYGNGGAASMNGWVDEVRVSALTFDAVRAQAEYGTMGRHDFTEYGDVVSSIEKSRPVASELGGVTVETIALSVAAELVSLGDYSSVAVKFDIGTDADNLETVDFAVYSEPGAIEKTFSDLLPGTDYFMRLRLEGDGMEPVLGKLIKIRTVGDPTIAAVQGHANMSEVILRAEAKFMGGVSRIDLLTGESPETLEVFESWENLSEGGLFEKTATLPQQGFLYYQFTVNYKYQRADGASVVLTASTEVSPAGKVFWTGAVGDKDFWNPENWTPAVVPLRREFLAIMDGDPTTNAYSELLFWSNTPRNVTNAAIVVTAGDTFDMRHRNWNGNVDFRVDRVCNEGTLKIYGGATANSNTTTIFDYDEGNVINSEGALLRIIGPGTNVRSHKINYRLNINNQNDGVIMVEHGEYGDQGGNNEARSGLNFVSAGGAFTNNGEIVLSSTAGADNTGSARMVFGDGTVQKQTYVLTGTGRLKLDLSQRVESGTGNPYETAVLIVNNEKRHKLVNDTNHTIEGSGYFKDLGLDNYGLIRASDSPRDPEKGVSPWPMQFRCYYNSAGNEFGARLENYPSGRMIAMETSGGLILGNKEHRSTFFNHGLLEARTGSKIEFRVGTTESVAKEGGDKTDVVGLGGVIAGDGTIVTYRPVVIKSAYELKSGPYPAAIVRPGNLALNAQGEDDGLGASLPGTLRFTTNVTFKAGSTLEIDGAKVDGAARVDRVEVDGAVAIESGAVLKITGKIPGGSHTLVASSLPIVGDFTVVCEKGASKVTLTKRTETEGEGEVAVVRYYLDGSFFDGFMLKVR